MPADYAEYSHVPSPAASGVNMGWSVPPSPPQSSTRGIPLEEASQYLAAEDALRQQGFLRYQGSAGGGSETPSEYTVHTPYAATEASTAKDKGRMP